MNVLTPDGHERVNSWMLTMNSVGFKEISEGTPFIMARHLPDGSGYKNLWAFRVGEERCASRQYSLTLEQNGFLSWECDNNTYEKMIYTQAEFELEMNGTPERKEQFLANPEFRKPFYLYNNNGSMLEAWTYDAAGEKVPPVFTDSSWKAIYRDERFDFYSKNWAELYGKLARQYTESTTMFVKNNIGETIAIRPNTSYCGDKSLDVLYEKNGELDLTC